MNKVILIIGATRGVGLVIANRLHQAGYRVFGICCNPNPAGAPFRLLPLNVGNEAAVKVSIYRAFAPESSDLNGVVIAPSGKVTLPPKAVLDPALAQREWQWNEEVPGLGGQRHEHWAPVVAVGQLASAHWL